MKAIRKDCFRFIGRFSSLGQSTTICPSAMRITRSAAAATLLSWVMSRTVVPCSLWSWRRMPSTCSPVLESRAPVGSSAMRMGAPVEMARGDGHPLLLAAGHLEG